MDVAKTGGGPLSENQHGKDPRRFRAEALITKTRHGRPVARLVSDTGGIDRFQARAAAERIRARTKNLKAGAFDWDALKADRDAGRP